ncbi:hypothetical protein HMPREF9439_01696 [Parasutterella excrementihominis YIT 11859]|uniref:Uncharacterized protein n=1 Tax=Parasutterella excrementihominis YIT 11859 TaxID=762966 RepID=F3QL79_9BURK|nr:hypothetical protein HMPREF9439_01696 [Parasutterella excrementihominis YIT 11859]
MWVNVLFIFKVSMKTEWFHFMDKKEVKTETRIRFLNSNSVLLKH